MNRVCLTGRLTRDAEIKQGEKSSIAKFTIAVNRQFSKEQSADFISCVAFGKTADFIAKYFRKGMKIEIDGRIQTGSYTNKSGAKVYTTDIVCETVSFAESRKDVENTPAEVEKTPEGYFMQIEDVNTAEIPFT